VKRCAAGLALAVLLISAAGCGGAPRVTLHTQPPWPEHLAAWGVVAIDGHRLVLADRALPYDVATPLFSDYAHKLRTVWMPEGTHAEYDAESTFALPVGAILTKTFYYPRSPADADVVLATEARGADSAAPGLDLREVRLVETRLLIHQQDGWVALAYVWNAAQDDAVLRIVGDLVPLAAQLSDGTRHNLNYLVPTKNDCTNCHATDHGSRAIQPIGIAARHLDKVYERYADGPAPQLARWQGVGYLTGVPEGANATRNAVWEPGATDNLEHRARSYLDINCGHCHNPRGSADTSALFLNLAESSPRHLGPCKPTVAAGRGTGGRSAVIVPGEPDASILTFRMESTDPGEMMPELGRTLVHAAGVALVREWVASLPGRCV
jgi:uncharacterized repeat protein (TIGR03806 family)